MADHIYNLIKADISRLLESTKGTDSYEVVKGWEKYLPKNSRQLKKWISAVAPESASKRGVPIKK